MNEACEVVRDLIPLCLDDAASEGSKRHVDTHMEGCSECEAYYAGMKAALPKRSEAEVKAEVQALDNMAKSMKKKKLRGTLKKVLLGAVIGAAVLGLAVYGWMWLQWKMESVYTGFYNVFLSKLSDGRVVFNVDYQGSLRHMYLGILTTEADDGKVYNIDAEWYTLKRLSDEAQQNRAFLTLDAEEFDELSAVYIGEGEDRKLVWERGMEIAPASQEMEEYYMWQGVLNRLYDDAYKEGPDGKVYNTSTYAQTVQTEVLHSKVEEASWAVPEWQPVLHDWYLARWTIDEDTLQWVMDELKEAGYLE